MNRYYSQIKLFSLRTLVFVALGASVLAIVFLAIGGVEDIGKQISRATESQLMFSDVTRDGRSNASGSEEDSRFAELAHATLFPGAKPHGTSKDELQRLATDLLDHSRPLKVRRQAAWALAKLRSREALALLRQGLSDASIHLKATIAEVLGNFDTPEARELLRMLLTSDNDPIARGATRGWARLGDSEALQLLAGMLMDSQKGADLRAEAALSLSKVNNARAYQVLVDGLSKIADLEIAKTILSGLGQRSFTETEPFFRTFLGRTDVPTDLRVAALESLGHVDGNPVPLLMQYLASDVSRLRAASAWTLSMVENPPDVAPQLLKRLESEGNADVRTRIYQALENQSNVNSEQLLNTVLNDQAVSSRVAGLKLLASQVSRQNNQLLASEFDSVAVPQLEKLAINGPELQNRMTSVIALKQARTPGALLALNRIAAQGIVAAASVK